MSDYINLLDKWTESGAKASSKHNDFILFRAEASTVRKRELKFNIKKLPRPIFEMVSLYCIKSLLAIISSECVNVLFVHNCCGEGTLGNVHGGEVLPLVFVNIVHFTAVQEYVLDSIVATHYIYKAAIDD